MKKFISMSYMGHRSTVILLSFASGRRTLQYILCFQCFFVCCCCCCSFRVKAFTSIPHYRDRVYDPDPERSDRKAKLEKLKRSNAAVESAVKNFRICLRIRRMRVEDSRIRKEKVGDSKISGYVWTGSNLPGPLSNLVTNVSQQKSIFVSFEY